MSSDPPRFCAGAYRVAPFVGARLEDFRVVMESGLATYLASQEADGITGQAHTIAGGQILI